VLATTTRLVPVVFGGVNYVEVLPHDAYIDALNQEPMGRIPASAEKLYGQNFLHRNFQQNF
jgi:hypothetical protein